MTTHDAVGGSVDVASRLAGYEVSRLPHSRPTGLTGRLVLAEMARLADRCARPPLFGDEVRFTGVVRRGRIAGPVRVSA